MRCQSQDLLQRNLDLAPLENQDAGRLQDAEAFRKAAEQLVERQFALGAFVLSAAVFILDLGVDAESFAP